MDELMTKGSKMSASDLSVTVPDTDTTKDRIRRYETFLTDHPAAGVPMPDLLRDEPEFAEFQAERAATLAARDRENQLWAEYQERCAKAKAKHDQMVERAAEAGGQWPEPYVQEVWRGRPLAPVQNPFDPHDRSPINTPGEFWDEKIRGIDAHERAVLIKKRAVLLDRVERRKDLKSAQAAVEAATLALEAAEATYAPFGDAVKLLNHLGESREEREERLRQERAAARAAKSAQFAYKQVLKEEDLSEALPAPASRADDYWGGQRPGGLSAEAAEIERGQRELDKPRVRRTHRR